MKEPTQLIPFIPPPKEYFSKVKEAREALRNRAEALLDQLQLIAQDAHANGEFQVAADIIFKLIEHTPADDEGNTILAPSVDKVKSGEKSSGPTVNIGFAVGGVIQPKSLPPASKVINGETED